MKILSRFLVGLLLSCAYSFSHPAWAQSAGWTAELAMQVKRVSHVRVSPDGRRVAFVVAHAVMEAEKVSGRRTSTSRGQTEPEQCN